MSDGTDSPVISSSFTIVGLPSTTTLTSTNAAPTTGQAITFDASVSPTTAGTAPPTGSVDFVDAQENVLAVAPLQSDGTASFSTSFTKAISDTITAVYSGDAMYASSFAQLTKVISAAPVSTAVTTFGRVILPAGLVAGSPFKASVPVVLRNSGANLSGTFTENLYAIPASGADGSQTFITSIHQKLAIKAKASRSIAIPLKSVPATLAAGTYKLIEETIDPNGGTTYVTSSSSVVVSAPIVRPVASAARFSPASILPGKSGLLTIIIANNGNISTTSLNLSVSAVTVDRGVPTAVLATESLPHLSLRAGTTIVLRLKVKIPADLASGNYYPVVNITLDGVSMSVTGLIPFAVR